MLARERLGPQGCGMCCPHRPSARDLLCTERTVRTEAGLQWLSQLDRDNVKRELWETDKHSRTRRGQMPGRKVVFFGMPQVVELSALHQQKSGKISL